MQLIANDGNRETVVSNSEDSQKKNPIEPLPREMIVEIFNKLKLSDLAQATRVCQEWHRLVDEKMKKEKSIWLNQHAFGKEQWKRYFDVSIESAPPYQRGFMANCLSKIPGNPKKK